MKLAALRYVLRLAAFATGVGFLATAHAAAPAAPVILAEGEPFTASLAGADVDWKLRFLEGEKTRVVGAADLVTWGAFNDPPRQPQVLLAGGGVIVAEIVKIENEQLRGHSPAIGPFELPLEMAAGIIFRPPLERATLDQLTSRIATAGGQTDRLLLDNGDELTGSVTGIDGRKLSLQTDAAKVDIAYDKLAAIVFNPTLTAKSKPSGLRMLVGLSDGSRLPAMELLSSGDKTKIKLAGNVQLEPPTDVIRGLQTLGGRATYLSDLKPSSYRHIPYLQLTWPYQTDRSVLNSPLRADSKLFAKGLGMHSPARITYDLDRPYRGFAAEVAIDDETAARGSAVFRVFTDDGNGAWQERATSPVLRGGQAPHSIAVDLSGAKRISLLVDYADRGDELDHADWLNARLLK